MSIIGGDRFSLQKGDSSFQENWFITRNNNCFPFIKIGHVQIRGYCGRRVAAVIIPALRFSSPPPRSRDRAPPSKHASNVFRSLFLDKKANEANSSCSTSKRRTNFVNGRDREEAIHTPRLPAFERESKPQLAKVRSN